MFRHTLVRGLAVVVIGVALVQVFYYFCRTVDDLFISLRYAERLIDGHGLTYNDGERVEGFSSPLWVVLQAALMALGVEGVVATKLLSLASYGALLVGVYRLARVVCDASRLGAWVAVGLVAASSYVAAWAMLGLETPLLLALLVHTIVAFHRAARLGLNPLPWRYGLALVALTLGLLMTRPEAPLYVLALVVAALVDQTGGWASVRATVSRLAPWLVCVACVVFALLVARKSYFGEWMPQTYYAKRGGELDLAKLAPIIAQGAPWSEVVVHLGGLVLAVGLGLRRRWALALCLLANLVFIVKVRVDWMPSMRHALPLVVLAAPLWGALVSRARWSLRLPAAALLLVYAVTSLMIDSRYAIYDHGTHGKHERWILGKSERGWETAWASITHEWPAHVAAMAPDRLGQVMQVFHTIEASDQDIARDWVIARDIGLLGWLTPVQVFETDGLFTPALTESAAWSADETVDDALLSRAFARPLATTELYGQWSTGLGRRADLRAQVDVIEGKGRAPVRVRSKGREPPRDDQLRARYDHARRRLDPFFYVATLYGESVGAAVEKRWQWMMTRLALSEPEVVARAPDMGSPRVVDGGAIIEHGCRVEGVEVHALVCYFEAKRPPSRDWQVFVHGLDATGKRVLHLDHAPVAGRRPATQWKPGEVIRDVTPLHGDVVHVELRAGLWHPDAGQARN